MRFSRDKVTRGVGPTNGFCRHWPAECSSLNWSVSGERFSDGGRAIFFIHSASPHGVLLVAKLCFVATRVKASTLHPPSASQRPVGNIFAQRMRSLTCQLHGCVGNRREHKLRRNRFSEGCGCVGFKWKTHSQMKRALISSLELIFLCQYSHSSSPEGKTALHL